MLLMNFQVFNLIIKGFLVFCDNKFWILLLHLLHLIAVDGDVPYDETNFKMMAYKMFPIYLHLFAFFFFFGWGEGGVGRGGFPVP